MIDSVVTISLEQVVDFTGGRLTGGRPGLSFSRVVTDSREARPGDLFVALIGDRFDGHDFLDTAVNNGASGILVHHPLQADLPERDAPVVVQVPDTLKALGDLAAGRRKMFPVPVGVLTGSNGKTTTKEMTVAVMRLCFQCLWSPGNFNNRIGLPLTLLNLDAGCERVILEMGMNEPGEIRELTRISRPDTGALLNIGPAHLGMFASMDEVAAAKAEMLEALPPESTFVFNRDDSRVQALARSWNGPVRSFGLTADCDVFVTERVEAGLRQKVRMVIQGEEISTEICLPGIHNLYNAVAAAALSFTMGASREAVAQGLESFQGVSGRFVVKEGQRFTVVDDSYNANPRSMQASLETFGAISGGAARILVLGDMLELGSFSEEEHLELGRRAARIDPALLCVTGRYAECVAKGAAEEGCPANRVILFQEPDTVAERILKSMRGGEWVLVKGSRGMALERVVNALEASERF